MPQKPTNNKNNNNNSKFKNQPLQQQQQQQQIQQQQPIQQNIDDLLSSDEDDPKIPSKSSVKNALKKAKKERDRELIKQLKEQQDMEIEALQAIYQDEFITMDPIVITKNIDTIIEGIKPVKESSRFRITLKPYVGDDEKCFVSVYLCIGFPEKYPVVLPNIQVLANKGISQKRASELEEKLQKESQGKIGNIMVFDLCEIVKEFLQQYNNEPTQSMHQQMLTDQKDSKKSSISIEVSNIINDTNNLNIDKKEWESTIEESQYKEDRKNFRLQKSMQRAHFERERKKNIVNEFTNTTYNQNSPTYTNDYSMVAMMAREEQLQQQQQQQQLQQQQIQSTLPQNEKAIDKQQTMILHLLRLLVQNDSNISADHIRTLGEQLVQLGLFNPNHLPLLVNMNNSYDSQIYQHIFRDYFLKPFSDISVSDSLKNNVDSAANNNGHFLSKFWETLTKADSFSNGHQSKGSSNGINSGMSNIAKTIKPHQQSRYHSDFEEIQLLGRGGFGQVVKVRNKLDGRYYAIKKIKLDSNQSLNRRILREVITLSRLHHQHVVRYYQAWIEGAESLSLTGSDDEESEEDGSGSSEEENYSESEEESSSESEEDESTSSEDESNSDESDSDEEEFDDQSFSEGFLFNHGNKRSLEFDLTDDSYSFLHSDSGFLFEVFDLNNKTGGNTRSSMGSSNQIALKKNNKKSNSNKKSSTNNKNKKSNKNNKLNNKLNNKSNKTNSNNKKSTLSNKPAYLYIQMEYCQKILRNLTEAGMNLEDDDIWKLFRQIVEGMAYVHSQGIIHRDLKPSNIFFDSCGDIKIGDFGLATNAQTNNLSMTSSTSSGGTSSSLNSSNSNNSVIHNQNNQNNQNQYWENEMLEGAVNQHTARVGTLFYTSPEQEAANGDSSYDDKVDMYSLGIVFFEMWYVFSTGHERVIVLRNLREKGEFPSDFERSHSRQAKLIKWLTERDPAKRPTSQELLQSELMPPKMEDEYIKNSIRVITNPTNQFYQTMLNSLFSSNHQNLHSHIYHHQQSSLISSTYSKSLFCSFDLLQVKDFVDDLIKVILRKHNANEMLTPQMYIVQDWEDQTSSSTSTTTTALSSTLTNKNVQSNTTASTTTTTTTNKIPNSKTGKSILMDDSGQLIELRHDLRVSFRNYLTNEFLNLGEHYKHHHNDLHNTGDDNMLEYSDDESKSTITTRSVEDILDIVSRVPIKRYEFGYAFRKPNLVGKLPKELSQFCFDIFGSDSLYADAETIKVATEIFDSLPSTQNYYFIRLNHFGIVEYMYKSVGITDAAQKNEIGQVLSQLIRQPWFTVKKVLLEKLKLPLKQVERLANWVLVKGTIPDVLKKLDTSSQNNPLLGNNSTLGSGNSVRVSSSFTDLLDDIRQLSTYFEKMSIPSHKIIFDLSYCFSENFYSVGTMFQVILKEEKHECLAVGGRYDSNLVCNNNGSFNNINISSYSGSFNQQQQRLQQQQLSSIVIPITGLSVAMDKIYSRERESLKQRRKQQIPPTLIQQQMISHKFSTPDIFVISLGSNLFMERIGIVSDLQNAGFNAETMYLLDPTPEEQTDASLACGAIYVVIIKEKGAKKTIKVKNIEKKKEDDISRDEIVKFFTLSNFTSKYNSKINR